MRIISGRVLFSKDFESRKIFASSDKADSEWYPLWHFSVGLREQDLGWLEGCLYFMIGAAFYFMKCH